MALGGFLANCCQIATLFLLFGAKNCFYDPTFQLGLNVENLDEVCICGQNGGFFLGQQRALLV